MMALLNHPLWQLIVPHLVIEHCGTGDSKRDRVRFEFRGMSPSLMSEALMIEAPCAACGHMIHPIRRRGTNRRRESGHLYLAVACSLDTDISCSRGTAARDAYVMIRKHAEENRGVATRQLGLFGGEKAP